MLEQHTELFYGTNSRTSISIMRTTPQTRFAGAGSSGGCNTCVVVPPWMVVLEWCDRIMRR